MSIVLIDNYDSYTYNLYQLLSVVCGREPVVMANDDPRLRELDVDEVEAVVISPGPGRPQNPADLGWCPEVLDGHPELPVLGVCLGHQAIAYDAGARVEVTVPRHGYLAAVTHEGTELFEGIPQGFRAVRYHSLHVPEPLPPLLRATAWAQDGTVMALRRRDRPWWGVQFHPESVATEYGLELMSNFVRLAGRRSEPGAKAVLSQAPKPVGGIGGQPQMLELSVETVDREVDAEAVFGELYADHEEAFWFDSSLVESGRARFSFLGAPDGPLGESLTYRVGSGFVSARRRSEVATETGNIFEVLQRRLDQRRVQDADLPFDLTCGYVGYFGYEAKGDCGGASVHSSPTPDAVWMFADRMIAIDHRDHRTYLLAVTAPTPEARAEGRRWIDATRRRVTGLIGSGGPAGSAPPRPRGAAGDLDLARGHEQYLADIERCLRELREGESYEICLTNRVRTPPVEDTLEYYRMLRRINPAPYAAYLRTVGATVMSSSPERFLRILRDGTVESKPIKGTVGRDPDPETDERLRASLTDSAKTRAENLMIVDLLRNDLGKVCLSGSVGVPSFLATESYATVHQLVSTIRGRLLPWVGAVDCVRACFPGGSMTGAPKLRTMEIIDQLEGEARGVYSGALGYFGLGGGADLSIVIRTAVALDSEVVMGAGGAIVLDSDPEEEFVEMMLKVDALVRAYEAVGRPPARPVTNAAAEGSVM